MAGPNIGTARADLTIDTRNWEVAVERAKNVMADFSEEAQAAYRNLEGRQKVATDNLIRYVQQLERSTDTRRLASAAERDVPKDIWIELAGRIQQYNNAVEIAEQETLALNRAWDEANAANKFLNQLRRQADTLGMTTSEMLEYRAAEMGLTAQAAPFIATLRAKEQALKAQGGVYQQARKWNDEYNMSQKQVEFAMRGLPAQMTDIFISLQGGQNPLTVLLQQGGQLKDMFGGVGNAARVLGGELVKLARNPFVLAAAAVTALLVAYKDAESRIDSFNSALILSGQQSSISADGLNELAMSLDELSGVTARQAAEGIAEIVRTGVIAEEQYELVAAAATRMQRVTGKAMSDTIAEYAELARDPYNAIMRFNEAENFLTNSIADRIKELQEAGKIEEAAALAQETRANAQIERTQQIEESLGLISGAWLNIKSGTGEAFDAASNYFTELDKKAKEGKDRLDELWRAWQTGGAASAFAMQAAVHGVQSVAGAATQADEEMDKVRTNARRQLDSIIAGNRTREEAQKHEIQRIKNLGEAAGYSAEKIQELVDASNRAYEATKPKGAKGRTSMTDEQRAALEAFKNRLKGEEAAVKAQSMTLKAEYDARAIGAQAYYDRLIELAQRESEAFAKSNEGQIAYLRTQKQTTDIVAEIAKLEAALTARRLEDGAKMQALAIEQDRVLKERREAQIEYQRSLDAQVTALARQQEAQVTSMGLSQREADMVQHITQLYYEQADALQQLEDQRRRGDIDKEQYDERVAALRRSTEEQVGIVTKGYSQMTVALGDWRSAYDSAVLDMMDESRNIYGQTKDVIGTVTSGLTDGFKQLAREGKISLSSIGDSLRDLAIEIGTNRIITWLMNMFAGQSIGGPQRQAIPFDFNVTPYAKGGVQDGSALKNYSNGIYDKPQLFAFAKGNVGVFGESGEEAIMPVARDSTGRLGVSVVGGGVQPPNITLNVYGAEGNPKVEMREGEGGAFVLDLIVGQVEDRMASGVMMGSSKLGTALKRRYNLREA